MRYGFGSCCLPVFGPPATNAHICFWGEIECLQLLVYLDTHILGVPTRMRHGFELCYRPAQTSKAKNNENASSSDLDALWQAAPAHVTLLWHKGLATSYFLGYLHLACIYADFLSLVLRGYAKLLGPKADERLCTKWSMQPFLFDLLAFGATSHAPHLLRSSDKRDYAAVLPHQSHNNLLTLVS